MRDWLVYSPSTGNVYCYVCKLFGTVSDSFSLNGFNDWKNAHRITTHELFGQNDNGNYLGLLELLSQFDPFLAEHIRRDGNKGRGQVSYLSSTICEEFTKLVLDRVNAKIIAEIKKAKYYSSYQHKSTPDIAHIDQLSIVI